MSIQDFSDIYAEAGQKYGVDPQLLMAQGQTESSGNTNVVSDAGAVGIAQLMPATAKSLGVTDATDPRQAIDAQARLMAENINKYGDVPTALMAYHGGSNTDNWGPKTRAYPAQVMKNYKGTQMADNSDDIFTEAQKGLDAQKASQQQPVTTQPSGDIFDEAQKTIDAEATKNTTEEKKQQSISTAADVAKSIPASVIRGVGAIPQIPLMAGNLAAQTEGYLYGRAHNLLSSTPYDEATLNKLSNIQPFYQGNTIADPIINSMSALTQSAIGNKLTDAQNANLEKLQQPNPLSGDITYNAQTVPGKLTQAAIVGGIAGPGVGAKIFPSVLGSVGGEIGHELSPKNPLATIAGGALGGGTGSLLNKGDVVPSITSDDIKAASQAKYEQAKASGASLDPNVYNNAINEMHKLAPQTEIGKALSGENSVTKALTTLDEYRDQPIDLQTAQEIDSHFGNQISKEITNTGAPTAEGRQLIQMQDAFRKAVFNAKPEEIAGGQDGFKNWQEGSGLWSSYLKLKDLEDIQERAQYSPNPQTYIRNQMAVLAKNPKRLNGYTIDIEQPLIKSAAKTGVISSILNVVGSRLNPIIAGSVGGPVGAAMGLGTSEGARAFATSLESNKLNAVQEAIRNRPIVKKAFSNQLQSNVPAYQNYLMQSVGIPSIANQAH